MGNKGLLRALSLMVTIAMLIVTIPLVALRAQADSTYAARSYYNSSTGDVFLGGKYLELGISKRGSFGTSAAATVSGFHRGSKGLGMIVDGDGWDTGASPTTGDFFLPDTPEERYILAYKYNGSTYEFAVADRMGSHGASTGSCGTWKTVPTVSNQSSGNTLKAVVSGVTNHGVRLEMTYSFGVEDKFFKTDVKIINESGASISDVRFVRSFDPDQDDDIYNTNKTYNKVICNPVSSKPASDSNYAMVVARGEMTLEGFFFIAFDNRARASQDAAFSPESAYTSGLWTDNTTLPTYATDSSIAMTKSNLNGYTLKDAGIAVTFALGTIANSKTDSLQYYSSLSPTVEDSLQDIMQPVAPVINSVTGATLEHGYTDGGPSVSATIAEDHTATYQWYRNTTNSNKGGTAVSGATESSYAVPLKHTVDSTEYYYCVITATRTDNGLAATTTSSAVAVVYQSGTHDWKETSRKEPTCTAEGSVGYACTLCPATKTEKLAKLGHEYVSVKVTQPTCTARGYTTYTCSCGDSYISNYVEPVGHDYQYSKTVEPTCTADGYMRYICSKCGAKKDQVLPATGHEFGDDNVCDKCGFTVPVSHTHSYTKSVTAPSCTDMGYTTYTCSCGYSYKSDFVEQLGHNWNEGVVTTAKTCTIDGVMTYTCQRCGVTKTETIPAGHEWDETITQAATCTVDGSKKCVCKLCGFEQVEVIPAGHKWNEGVVTKEATCTEPGAKTVTCSVCGATENQEIPALGHNFYNGVCTRCGIGIPGIVTPNPEHSLYGMFFAIDEILSNYGRETINEYGVYLDHNPGAKIKRVGVYLTQDGTMWRRAIACVGEDITYATYVPYLAKDKEVKYSGLNSNQINIFRLAENSDGIWCYSNYTTIGVNLEDAQGNLLLSLYDIGQAGKDTRIFTDLDEMIEWLKYGDCDHNYTTVVTPADCEERGYTTYTCTKCGDSYKADYTEPTGHDYRYTETVEPTCTADGYMRYTCTKCGDKKDQVLLSEGHDFGDDNVCDKCGFTIPGSHTHTYTKTVTAPTCTDVGYTTYTCSCGYSYKDNYIEQLGHKWGEGVVTTPNTCTESGVMTYTCSECGEKKTETIPAGHDWTETITKEATCTEDGSMTRVCKRCGERETEIIPAGHDWDEGTVTKEATCTEPGTKTVTCKRCGRTDVQEIPARGHEFVNGVCKDCGAKVPDVVVPDYDHDLYGMFFRIDDIISNYGPEPINEYGVYLDHNPEAKIQKVGVYLTQDGTMWRRTIACVGEDITYATYVPYLSYDEDIKYTGLNNSGINIFRLKENSDGIWCYSNYATIGANLEDRTGKLLLTLTDIGQAGKDTRIFTDLDEMIAWLKEPTETGDFNNDGLLDVNDVEYLLWHTILGDLYPVGPEADLNGDGVVTSDDVLLLLLHISMPDMFPLK